MYDSYINLYESYLNEYESYIFLYDSYIMYENRAKLSHQWQIFKQYIFQLKFWKIYFLFF